LLPCFLVSSDVTLSPKSAQGMKPI
jgi:hypothetical protein